MARVLIALQATLAATAAIEVAFMAAVGMAGPWAPVPTATLVVVLFWAATRFDSGLPRWFRRLEWTLVVVTALELAASFWLAGTPLPPATLLTRMILPLAVLITGGRR
ncbi:MAG: hypothetical protein OEX04_03840 [Acidimicrobiia bacterium]|nr:hypothetical protein [Acidimicrobiia bacterium]MDH4306588.1 hypothetical protein [Acidimicrobiia bacterium]